MLEWYILGMIVISALALIGAAAAAADGEEEGAALCLLVAFLSFTWPVTIPLAILGAIVGAVIFILKTLWNIGPPKWWPGED